MCGQGKRESANRRPIGARLSMERNRGSRVNAEFAGAVPLVVTFDDDQAAAASTVSGLEQVSLHQCGAQQIDSFEVDLDFRKEPPKVFPNLTEPPADFLAMERLTRAADLRVDEIGLHEERCNGGGFAPAIGILDEGRNTPGRGPAVTGLEGDTHPATQHGKLAAAKARELQDHVGAYLLAQKVHGKHQPTRLEFRRIK